MGGFVTGFVGLYAGGEMIGQNDRMTKLAIPLVFSALNARVILALPSPGEPSVLLMTLP